MNRRNLFRLLGLGAASAAAAPVLAAMPKAPPPEIMVTGRYPGNGEYEAVRATQTGPGGQHQHTVHFCACDNTHSHGCSVHRTGVYGRVAG
ncbi:hypothetical protein N8D56_04945 [Devosia sp. A8/3-2]|nr:hypothetical protein N8D56_04945 [Devosia sp. A8/3-2]